MAKGNMLQGMARGKVGDVVFSRLNGEQISRVRNRHPKNPRTNPQLYQRAVMATVLQAYSAGQEIFNHAFQGKAVGEQNMRRFLSLNAKKLRSQLAAELDNNTTLLEQQARVVAPGSITPVPFKMQVSEGSYPQTALSFDTDGYTLPAASGTPAEYAAANGLVSGDIYTIVCFGIDTNTAVFSNPNYSNALAKQFACQFAWMRLRVKDVLATTGTAAIDTVFDIEEGGMSAGNTPALGSKITITTVMGSSYTNGGIACIRSRADMDLRSNSDMVLVGFTNFGIATQYALPIWKAGAESVGDSDLILEGGDVENFTVGA